MEAEINISINCHTIHELMPMMKSYWPTHGSHADFPPVLGEEAPRSTLYLSSQGTQAFQRLLLSLELRTPAWGSWPLLLVR